MADIIRPLVTIAIPTYNRANTFLKEAINCAINQTYPNLEIVISNNCSTDRTEEVIRNYTDKRIRYFKQDKNIGANNNFNFCIEQARGEYFMMLLDDDLIDNDFIETCMNAASDNTNMGIIRTGTRILDADGNVLLERPNTASGLSTTDFFLAWFRNETTLYVCSTLFNTRWLREAGGFMSRHNLFQDVLTEVKLAAKHGRVDIYDVKAGFRIHADNMGTAAKVGKWCEDSFDLLNTMCELVPENRDVIRKNGMPFFCKMHYNLAAASSKPIQRLSTYFMVANKFNYSYSPLLFIYQHEIKKRLKRKLFGNKTL